MSFSPTQTETITIPAGRMSRILLILNLLGAGLLAAAVLFTRERFRTMFEDFGMELPGITDLVMAVPRSLVVLSLAILCAALVAMERVMLRTSARLTINLIVCSLLFLLWCLYIWAMLMPLSYLVKQLQ